MKRSLTLILALAMVIISVISFAENFKPHKLTLQEKKADFTQLLNQINNSYGPKLYKEEKLGIDLKVLGEKYWTEIEKTTTNAEFYSLVIRFVSEFHDGHFWVRIPTQLKATLPFDVTRVEDKIVIEKVDRDELTEEQFPFDRGDILVSMDGKAAEELVNDLKRFRGIGNLRMEDAMGVWFLTWRPGSMVEVPSGKVTVTLQKRETGELKTVELEWKIDGEYFDEMVAPSALTAMKAAVMPVESSREAALGGLDLTQLSAFDIYDGRDAEQSYHCSGKTRIDIPEDATTLIDDPFVAYYYATPKGNVGYIRIPHYSPPEGEMNAWFENYKWALTKLQGETVGLIIDQDHNCGGSIAFMESLVSLFMSKEVRPLEFQFRASKEEILGWQKELDSAFNTPHYIMYDAMTEVVELMKDAFERGDYLTTKTTIRGSLMIEPQSIYTKSIIVLADLYSGSCGDAFPAMMQGTGRAKILGSTTMGLGGHVVMMTPLFYSQLTIRMTKSLFYHPNGTAIENNGVTPDIPYEITMEDFTTGYKPYREFYTNELLKLIQ